MMVNFGKGRCIVFSLMMLFAGIGVLAAQNATDIEIPITRISLFSSGVGYFEHAARITGNATTQLPFTVSAVNDVLKSLIITDTGSNSPTVTYSSEDTLSKTLSSLKINLSENPGIAEILDGLRGAELIVNMPGAVTGRIIGVETRPAGTDKAPEAILSLLTKDGVKVVSMTEITSFTFTDRKITDDLNRALDLILSSRDSMTRKLQVNLPGKGERDVTLGYVIAAPVWKASYRLDLAAAKPVLQGWAIIDNTGDLDWNNVQLSLVTGRPVSFIQNLYPPLLLQRPLLPLAIAGVAEAETYESGYNTDMNFESKAAPSSLYDEMSPSVAKAESRAEGPKKKYSLAGGLLDTAIAQDAGEQFVFTVQKPVTLARQQSAMIPLVEAAVQAEKISVFSGTKAEVGKSMHPKLCAELTNTTGMKLPAGPITVFDGGTYAGDALIEFFPENDKRIIAFGEDLAVTGTLSENVVQDTAGVTLNKGVMTILRKYTYSKTYAFRNLGKTPRKVVIEHPVLQGATLAAPVKPDEKTPAVYRFNLMLKENSEAKFEVKEQTPVQETVVLTQLEMDAFVYYSSSRDIPAKVRSALEKAIEFKRKVDEAKRSVSLYETKKSEKIAEQERIRQNLEAAGNESQQGKEYLGKLTATDTEIDSIAAQIETARKTVRDAQNAYESYLGTLTLE